MVGNVFSKFLTKIFNNLERKKQARLRIWNSFCDETPLQGFLIYRNSHFRYERAIWMLLVVAAVGVTINDSVRTIGQFMDEEILSKVTMEQNDTISIPRPTICLNPREMGYYIPYKNASAIRSFLNHNRKKITHMYGPLVAKLESSNRSAVQEAVKYLIRKAAVVVPLLVLSQVSLRNFEDPYFLDDIFAKWLKETQNATGIGKELVPAEVLKTSAMFLCQLLSLQIIRRGPDLEEALCRRQYVTQLNPYGLCIRSNVPTIEFTRQPGHLATFSARSRLSGMPTTGTMVLDFGRSPDGVNLANVVSAFSQKRVEAHMELTTTQYFPTSKSPCDKTDSWIDCAKRCEGDMTKQRCKCFPLWSFYLYCSGKVCGEPMCRDEYHINGSINGIAQSYCVKQARIESTKCKNKCPKPCLLMNLEFRISNDRLSWDNSTEIELTFERQTYLSIVQSPAMDTQTFVSNLGGNLGLYIGGTFLALIHLFTSVARLLISLLVAKDDNEAEESIDSNELQHSGQIAGHLKIAATHPKNLDLQSDTSKQIKRIQEELTALRQHGYAHCNCNSSAVDIES